MSNPANPHLVDGDFQSDKYPTTPRGKVPLSTKDPMAQDLLWQYAQRRRAVDAAFSEALELALVGHGYVPAQRDHEAKALQLLLLLVAAVYYAMDDSEEVEEGAHKIERTHVAKICAVIDRLDTLPDDQPGYTMGPAAMAGWHLRRLTTDLGLDNEGPDCVACDLPMAVGDRYLPDASGGVIHAECCGPERESYVGADGEPLQEGEPIPQPLVWGA